jgi:hypothetical protein
MRKWSLVGALAISLVGLCHAQSLGIFAGHLFQLGANRAYADLAHAS